MNSLSYNFDLIRHLVRCDFAVRYKGSVLGVLWSPMLPLAQLLVLVFLFQKVVPLNIDAYPAFVFSALLPWTWFSTCLSSSGSLLINNRGLVRRPNFTPATLIITNTLSNMLNYLVVLPILFVMLAIYDKTMTLALLILPLLILIQGVLIVGLSLIIAMLNVFYRDVQHIMSIVLMLLFYMTPVFYQPQAVSENFRILYMFSPIAVLIQGYRAIFFYGTFPEWRSLLFAGTTSIFVCVSGYLLYRFFLHDIIDTI
ncbi:MAG: ABC transporter permease [Candidatus Brocadia sp. AMX2]|uniref:Transport permease protein n=1 Tax=Candidatus Brocadia sinica JPN1 TaxID=1197129 RepID=A0ABQ0JWI1_9BACT|nr:MULTISPECIES: ABC transporter permease [Brocadia]MBC6931152.1 ABC transporter permease [Candidatus Brocadia sp.]MBL1167449.1 ABC transporter permease [Candidatus Brocadia sp. AMX1]MCK6466677.1 ABC transporter permease [Candidatus Brocadia sinica]NOG41078.1 ABC transporter permease [Planctomycetota bacterium]KAA0244679.1 MAG: ABC transporter permease [Candidatus Brocadia sp. AMX2]